MVASNDFAIALAASRAMAAGEFSARPGRWIAPCRPDRRLAPESLAEAARLARICGADLIDINMGCPSKRVVGGARGLGADARPRPCRAADRRGGQGGQYPGQRQDAARLGRDVPECAGAGAARRGRRRAMVVVHGRTRSNSIPATPIGRRSARSARRSLFPSSPTAIAARLEDAREMLALRAPRWP